MSFVMAEFTEEMLKFTDLTFEEIAPQLLEEAAPMLEDATKASLQTSIRHTGDSELVRSVRISKPKMTKTDACVVSAYPTGESTHTYNRGSRKYPVSNALKAIWLEYGVAGRQSPRPWIDRAIRQCQNQVEAAMQKKYEELTKATGAK